jgi:hypothetical protein
MRIITVFQLEPFGESQTYTQRQNRVQARRVFMNGAHLNRQAVRCPIKPNSNSNSSRTVFEKAIAITGGCYE